MYLSLLIVDVGTNPDRPRPGRLWLRNTYRIHQRLCMAFPSRERKDRDPEFLKPYSPEDFSSGAGRPREASFLFRVDPQTGKNPAIVVQSALRPDWDYAFHNALHFLAAPPSVREYHPSFSVGDRLRFRLKANAIKRARQQSLHPSGAAMDPKWIGKRVPVPRQSIADWLNRRAEGAGFALVTLDRTEAGYVYLNKTAEPDGGLRLRSVLFEGVLSVTEPAALAKKIESGIGSGKAFGFGLLSVARMEPQ